MSFYDLREFLSLLDSKGELHRIEAKVDPDWEVGAILQRILTAEGLHSNSIASGIMKPRWSLASLGKGISTDSPWVFSRH